MTFPPRTPTESPAGDAASSGAPVVLVTGASSGIGAAIVARLRGAGKRVFATMRRPDPAVHGADAIAMDVTSDASVEAAVAEVLARAGRIDAVVNNAGANLLGAVEETTADEALALVQLNLLGVHRVARAVLPTMRAQGAGRIVTIGSVAGFLPTPYQAFYAATKHALEGYVESLDYEIAPFGLRALLIEPGFVRTHFGANGATAAQVLPAYARTRANVAAALETDVAKGMPPEAVADAVVRVIDAKRPPQRTLVGSDARTFFLVRRLLPPALFRIGGRRRLARVPA
jgi:NAD(P)-dependent dehydrogenase (short-subunit alcohol dehydrogenase family)